MIEFRPIYSIRKIGGDEFMLAERADTWLEAQQAAVAYRAEDSPRLYVRVEMSDAHSCYYIWVREAPHDRKMPRILPGEKVKRRSSAGTKWHVTHGGRKTRIARRVK